MVFSSPEPHSSAGKTGCGNCHTGTVGLRSMDQLGECNMRRPVIAREPYGSVFVYLGHTIVGSRGWQFAIKLTNMLRLRACALRAARASCFFIAAMFGLDTQPLRSTLSVPPPGFECACALLTTSTHIPHLRLHTVPPETQRLRLSSSHAPVPAPSRRRGSPKPGWHSQVALLSPDKLRTCSRSMSTDQDHRRALVSRPLR